MWNKIQDEKQKTKETNRLVNGLYKPARKT